MSLLLFAALFFGPESLAQASSLVCEKVSAESSPNHESRPSQAPRTESSHSSESGTCPDFGHCHNHAGSFTLIPTLTPLKDLLFVQIESPLALAKIWTPSDHISELFRPPTCA